MAGEQILSWHTRTRHSDTEPDDRSLRACDTIHRWAANALSGMMQCASWAESLPTDVKSQADNHRCVFSNLMLKPEAWTYSDQLAKIIWFFYILEMKRLPKCPFKQLSELTGSLHALDSQLDSSSASSR